ncbi:MAG: diacylglycerol kinase [Pseudorhodobacter sp.]|nr:diacylglycerol kinase [Pseudorhodobacter sp.]
MPRLLTILALLAVLGFATFWVVTAPRPLPASAVAELAGDAQRGEAVFWAGGCASCHAAPEAKGDAVLVLGGGRRFPSPFGTFIAPNISPDRSQGIGGWSLLDLANAMTRGVSPAGQHYFPAFPYASFIHAELQDVADLKAFLDTLPASAAPSLSHEVPFPFNIRRSLGGWKLLFLRDTWVVTGDLTPDEQRGRTLVEALGHCGECHTPRNILGGMDRSRWLAGAPDPSGKGTIPNITPAKLRWTAAEIAAYLATGFTPEFDSVGGHMAKVVDNFAHLPQADREAVAAYLKRVLAQP